MFELVVFDCGVSCITYYQIYNPNLKQLFPLFVLPSGIDTYFLEIDCSSWKECAGVELKGNILDEFIDVDSREDRCRSLIARKETTTIFDQEAGT